MQCVVNYYDCSTLHYHKQQANDFSDYQLYRLKHRSHLTRKLQDVRKTLNSSQSASYGIPEGTDCEIEANRIASFEGHHYILIKGKDVASSGNDDSQEEDDSSIPVKKPESGSDTAFLEETFSKREESTKSQKIEVVKEHSVNTNKGMIN